MSLLEARFLGRANRFLAYVEVDGQSTPCHLPNPGRLKELLKPGSRVFLREISGPRKTGFDLVAVEAGQVVVSLDTRLPNRTVRELLIRGELEEFQGYSQVLPEVRVGRSRLDFLLRNGRDCYVEVKSCTLVEGGVAIFPDAPTTRGRRHLEELMSIAHSGHRASVVFVIQRPDAFSFRPNERTDPLFSQALRTARRTGVEVYAYSSRFDGIRLVEFRSIQTSLGPA